MRKLYGKEEQRIVSEYEDGLPLGVVGEIHSLSAYFVKQILLKNGIKIRNTHEANKVHKKQIPEEWWQMLKDQKNGMTYEQIAEKWNCHTSTVNHRLRKIRERTGLNL